MSNERVLYIKRGFPAGDPYTPGMGNHRLFFRATPWHGESHAKAWSGNSLA